MSISGSSSIERLSEKDITKISVKNYIESNNERHREKIFDYLELKRVSKSINDLASSGLIPYFKTNAKQQTQVNTIKRNHKNNKSNIPSNLPNTSHNNISLPSIPSTAGYSNNNNSPLAISNNSSPSNWTNSKTNVYFSVPSTAATTSLSTANNINFITSHYESSANQPSQNIKSNFTNEYGLWKSLLKLSRPSSDTTIKYDTSNPTKPRDILELKVRSKLTTSIMIAIAMNILENSQKQVYLDSYRLYFKAGILFDDVDIEEKAISCYEKVISFIESFENSVDKIVDFYDMSFDTIEYKRKIERISSRMLDKFIQLKKEERDRFIKRELERQRLSMIFSNLRLLRLYLKQSYPQKAHGCVCKLVKYLAIDYMNTDTISTVLSVSESLLETFSFMSRSLLENGDNQQSSSVNSISNDQLEVLYSIHFVIKQYACKLHQSNIQTSSSVGERALLEAHIQVLLQLYNFEPQNAEVAEWLGIRYAEILDFKTSQYYYKIYDEIINPYKRNEFLNQYVTRIYEKPLEHIQASKAIEAIELNPVAEPIDAARSVCKIPVRVYQWDKELETEKQQIRNDFTDFGGHHLGTNVVMYKTPNQGWLKSIENEHNLYQDFKCTVLKKEQE